MAVPGKIGIISLEDAKRYLPVTVSTYDRKIDEMVSQACSVINDWLGYNVISQSYREYHSGTGRAYLWLENVPVTQVDLASTDRDDVATVTYDNGDASRATVQVTDVHLKLSKRVAGTTTTNDLVLSDHATITALVSDVNTLTGWTSVVVDTFGDYTPAELVIVPAQSAKDRIVNLVIPEESETEYEIEDADSGRLYNPKGWDYGHKNILIEYTAGYAREDVPEAIRNATLELVKLFYDWSKQDGSLESEKIGDYSYRKGAGMSSAVRTQMSVIREKLQPHAKVVVRGV